MAWSIISGCAATTSPRPRCARRTDGDGADGDLFLDGIPFPTGITVWRKGVLVCAAPDILYAEDTDGDGKADVVRKLYSGFGTHNFQARVNSLEYGLDGWVYGSCGAIGGTIQTFAGGSPIRLGNRDFRIRPDTGVLEPATGRTQQGRVRDDWGNWFGCDNTTLCRHYPLADHYLRRNPHVAAPTSSVFVPDYPNANTLYPAQGQLQLFSFWTARLAHCDLWPRRLSRRPARSRLSVQHLHVRTGRSVSSRLQLSPRESTFSGKRAANETKSEFFASTDTVPARASSLVLTGAVDRGHVPLCDRASALDPTEDLANWTFAPEHSGADLPSAAARARIAAWKRLDKLDGNGLVARLIAQRLATRHGPTALALARRQVGRAGAKLCCKLPDRKPGCRRVQPGWAGLLQAARSPALADSHAGVRRHAVRLAETFLTKSPELGDQLLKLLDDPDAQVRLQLAYCLGFWKDPRAGQALANLALRHPDDAFLTAAVLSSVERGNLGPALATVLANNGKTPPPATLVGKLVGLAPAFDAKEELIRTIRDVTTQRDSQFANWQFAALAGVLDALARRGQSMEKWLSTSEIEAIRKLAVDAASPSPIIGQTPESRRLAAL